MGTHQLAGGLVHIPFDPIAGVNAYLVGDVLVDAGSRHDAAKILRAIAGRAVTLHALTHVHPDHQGSSKAVVERLRVPFAAPRGETDQAASGTFEGLSASTRRAQLSVKLFAGPGCAVDRELREGDEVGGFTVIGLPGHTPGQIGFWRERDRILVAGDAFRNLSYATGRGRPALPPEFFGIDAAGARASVEKIAMLKPAVLAMGHGSPLIGASRVRRALITALDRS